MGTLHDDEVEVRRERAPFATIPSTLARDPSIGDKALRLWVVLDTYANRARGDSYPSIARLCDDLGCTRSTVHRAILELTDRALLRVESGGPSGRANTYTLVDPPGDNGGGVCHPRHGGVSPMTYPPMSPMTHQQEPIGTRTKNQRVDAGAPTALRLVDIPSNVDAVCTSLANRVETHRGQRPKITARWHTDMRLLMERGPREWAEPTEISDRLVEKVINGIFTHLAEPDARGFCWADQVRSPAALRRHWDAICLAGKARKTKATTRRSNDELLAIATAADQRRRNR